MGIYAVKARQNRKTGRAAITFEVDPGTWRNMALSAEDGDHPDTLDYVAGRLNMAFLDDFPQQAGPVNPNAAKGEAGPEDKAPDMDDGLPF